MRITTILLMLILASCGSQQPGIKGELNKLSEADLQEKYSQLLQRVGENIVKKNNTELPAYLETCLKDSVFEYWYDTPWDFNGITEIPRKGNIACGYFVTTTLKHLGLKIDRVYLAQQASAVLIKEVCDPASVKIFTNLSYKKMAAYVKDYPGTIFIAGLDNHVGFMVKEKGDMFFIHASGISPYKVIKEKCDESTQLTYSKYHMVGHINFSRWIKAMKSNG